MVASARFCSSPVSATAAQETLKRFQYESIQTLVPLSLSLPPCFSYPFFPPPLFPSLLSPQFRVPTSSPLILSSSLSYRFLLPFLQNSHVFSAFSESRVREARNREESRHLRNLFRETITFSCRYQ